MFNFLTMLKKFESNSREALVAGPERLAPEQVLNLDSKKAASHALKYDSNRKRFSSQ